MTPSQIAIAVILILMLIAYATEKFRVEVVAMAGLAAGFASGVVALTSVFSGFSSAAVITVVEVLLIVSALNRTRVMDGLARHIVARASNERLVLLVLMAIAASISVFMNNIGALALMFPVVLSVCARLDIPPPKVLMAVSFATLLGGLCSLTGTPANLVVNEWVIGQTGRSLGYFELGVVGLPLTVAGIALLTVLSPKILHRFKRHEAQEGDARPSAYVVEREVAIGSTLVGMRVPEIETQFEVAIFSVARHDAHIFARRSDIVIAAGDTILMEGPTDTFQEMEVGGLLLTPTHRDFPPANVVYAEFVVMPDSLLLGSRISDLESYSASDARVVACASRRGRVEGRFADLQIAMGDVLVLTGDLDDLRQIAAECGLLALTPRRTTGRGSRSVFGIAVFALGILATAFGVAPTEIAFGAVVLLLAISGHLNFRTALQEMNWTIVILLACMIPLGIAVEDTGAAGVIANGIAEWLPSSAPVLVAMTMLILAVLITPFIDNVSTAIVLSPIAVGLAARTGTPVEPALIAVAIGVSLDFLTPFGHHNNAVVMGAAGYRFVDFSRLGAPLLALCLVLAAAIFALGVGI